MSDQRRGTGRRQALVIGAGMAGLVTARVLADHFDQVTLLDRDRLPADALPRKGVPQGHHLHLLLARGGELLERLFPGLQADLAAAGAHWLDSTADLVNLNQVGWATNRPTGIQLQTFSRPLLEAQVRVRVVAHPCVRLRDGCEVTGLLAGADGGAVTGVRVRSHPPAGQTGDGAAEEVGADLVVDASGRASRAPRWLQTLGYPAPRETIINSFLGYASRYYALPSGFRAPWKGIYLQYAPPAHLRGGALLPVEGDRWLVGLVGLGRDYPPTDEPGFLAFARSLRSPLLYDAIEDARPLLPIAGYRGTENRWRHYERLPRWPEGFVLVGDAVCTFNPVYGQGMTTAAIGALTLAACLQERRRADGDLRGLTRRFQRRLARDLTPAWLLSTGGDLRSPATEGGQAGLLTRLLYRYVDRLLLRVGDDPRALRLVLEVYHLRRPLPALFHPRVLVPALFGRPGGQNPWATGETRHEA